MVDFVFLDSGIGGIPYMTTLLERDKNACCVYVADSANFPYGEKTHEEVLFCVTNLVQKICTKFSPSVIVLACNTISVNALDTLRIKFPEISFVGTVPAIKLAASVSKKRRIGLLATLATCENPYNTELKDKFASDCKLIKRADPELISFIEHNAFTATREECLKAVKPAVEFFKLQCKILSAYITPSLVGYDLSTEIPFFAYSSNGGIMSTNFSSFDFTGASLIFASQNTKTSYMPEFLIRYNTDPKCFSTLQDIVYVKLKVGSENVRIKCVQNMKESILPSSAFIQPFSTLEITENAVCVKSVILRNFSNVHNSRIQDQGSEFYILS